MKFFKMLGEHLTQKPTLRGKRLRADNDLLLNQTVCGIYGHSCVLREYRL